MAYFETVPSSEVRPGDELMYLDGTQFVEFTFHMKDGVRIQWASAKQDVTLDPVRDRVHRVIKRPSEERKDV